jgi:hypothetical protein
VYEFCEYAHVCGSECPTEPVGVGSHLLTIELVGSHPLWAHHLRNASVVMADVMCGKPLAVLPQSHDHPLIAPLLSPPSSPSSSSSTQCVSVKGKRVLELGAGGAVPSLVRGRRGEKERERERKKEKRKNKR